MFSLNWIFEFLHKNNSKHIYRFSSNVKLLHQKSFINVLLLFVYYYCFYSYRYISWSILSILSIAHHNTPHNTYCLENCFSNICLLYKLSFCEWFCSINVCIHFNFHLFITYICAYIRVRVHARIFIFSSYSYSFHSTAKIINYL